MKVPKFYYVPNAIILVYICSSIQQANAQLFSVVPISPVGSSPLSSYPPAISSYVKTQHSLDPTESVPTGIMPQVSEVSAMCVAGGGGMHAHISFDRPFSGRIYSIGYGNVHECIYYNGFYTKSVLFSIPLTGCGTRTTKNTRQVVDMIENRVYVQIDKYTLSAGDRKYAFVCELAPTPSDYAGQSGTGFSGTGFGNPIDALQVNVNEIRRRPVSNPSLPFAMPPIQPIVPQNAPKDYLFSPSAKPSALDPSFPKSIQPATLLYANKQWHIPPENVLSNLRNSGHRFAAGPQIPHPNGVGQNGNYFPTVIVPVVPNAGKEIDPFGTSNIFNDNSRNLEKEINDLNNGLLTVDDKELVLGHRSSYSTTPADPFNIGETTHKPAEETTTIRPTTSTSPPTTTEKVESTTGDDRGSVWSVVPLFPKTHEPEEFGDANPLGATLTVGGGTGARKDSPSTQTPVRMYANQKSESELSSLTDVDRSIYLEIRRGGTTPENSSRVDGVVKIGEPIMLVVHARAPSKDPKQYSIFVHSCYSSDGSDASHIQLIDHSGCAVHPQVIGSMQRQHSKYDPKEIIYYFTMKAFKFPINNDVFFFCSVDISPDYNFPELCSENDSTRRRLARRELVPVREAYLNNEADIVHNSRLSTITTDPRIVKASSIKPDEKSGYEVKIVSQNVSVQMEPETWNDTDFVMIKGITEQSLGSITPLSSGNSAKLLTHNFEEIIAGSNAKTIWLSIAIGIAGILIFVLSFLILYCFIQSTKYDRSKTSCPLKMCF